MKTLRSLISALLLVAGTSLLVYGERTEAQADEWKCVAANDPVHGLGHYDNVLEGWVVTAPDGQHVSWGSGTDCLQVHTAAGPD